MTQRIASTFKDPELEKRFQRDSYVIVPGFLNPAEIKQLNELFEGIHKPVDKFMWDSLYDIPVEMRGEVSSKILEVFAPKMEATFNDAKCPVGTIMSRTPNRTDAIMHTHRDYTILDEDVFEYRQVWCSLVDVNKDNGALFIIPGSHNKVSRILATLDVCKFREYGDKLLPYSKIIDAKAGDLVIYADRTLHGAFSNTTPNERPVVHFGFYPHAAQLYYFFRNKDLTGDTVEVYAVDDEFYTSQDSIINDPDARLKRPLGYPLIKVIDYPNVEYSDEDLRKIGTHEIEEALA
jgi:hypothetical protein